MTLQMPTVREILKRLDPALAPEVKEPQYLAHCQQGELVPY